MQEKYNDTFQDVATAFSGSSQSCGERETSTEPEVYLRGTGSNHLQFVCGGASCVVWKSWLWRGPSWVAVRARWDAVTELPWPLLPGPGSPLGLADPTHISHPQTQSSYMVMFKLAAPPSVAREPLPQLVCLGTGGSLHPFASRVPQGWGDKSPFSQAACDVLVLIGRGGSSFRGWDTGVGHCHDWGGWTVFGTQAPPACYPRGLLGGYSNWSQSHRGPRPCACPGSGGSV